jgi:hypothetical protein
MKHLLTISLLVIQCFALRAGEDEKPPKAAVPIIHEPTTTNHSITIKRPSATSSWSRKTVRCARMCSLSPTRKVASLTHLLAP